MNIASAHQGDTANLSKELADFARRQLVNATLNGGIDRRREKRHAMMVPVLAVPVDDQNQPLGDPFQAITRDLCATSVGLIHADPIEHDRLAIAMTIADTNVNLVISMTRKTPMGPFYGSAGKFVERLDRFPA